MVALNLLCRRNTALSFIRFLCCMRHCKIGMRSHGFIDPNHQVVVSPGESLPTFHSHFAVLKSSLQAFMMFATFLMKVNMNQEKVLSMMLRLVTQPMVVLVNAGCSVTLPILNSNISQPLESARLLVLRCQIWPC